MFQAMIVIEVNVAGARRKMPEKGYGLQNLAGDEDGASRQQPGKKLSCHDDFAANRRKEIEVQAAIEDFAAEEVHENSEASEEDSQAQEKELEDAGEHDGVLAQVVGMA